VEGDVDGQCTCVGQDSKGWGKFCKRGGSVGEPLGVGWRLDREQGRGTLRARSWGEKAITKGLTTEKPNQIAQIWTGGNSSDWIRKRSRVGGRVGKLGGQKRNRRRKRVHRDDNGGNHNIKERPRRFRQADPASGRVAPVRSF